MCRHYKNDKLYAEWWYRFASAVLQMGPRAYSKVCQFTSFDMSDKLSRWGCLLWKLVHRVRNYNLSLILVIHYITPIVNKWLDLQAALTFGNIHESCPGREWIDVESIRPSGQFVVLKPPILCKRVKLRNWDGKMVTDNWGKGNNP